MSISFTKLQKFSFIIFPNKFSVSWSSTSPSVFPMIQMLALLEIFHSLLILSSFFFHCFQITFNMSLFYFILFLIILLLFSYSCLHFLPNTPHPTPAKPTSLPCFHPPPWFCPCVLYSSSSDMCSLKNYYVFIHQLFQ